MTSASDWEKLKTLLDEVVDIDPADRRTYLENQSVDRSMVIEIESLLEHSTRADKVMDQGAVELAMDMIGADIDDEPNLAGMQIGPYFVVSELGVGGMGTVYLAERKDGKFDQRVAIKLLKREFNIERIRRAFRLEVEILSKLSHPNIARLFDTGTTADQIPYIVMEYVEGVPIDKFCAANKLTLLERLKLFNRVCDAVGFAHRNLIVHCDIKPSNVLVTSDGVPMLLDFGISKFLVNESVDDEQVRTLLKAMTPVYASPEQKIGEPLTTASDVYSLGVLLYRMLTGELPIRSVAQNTGDPHKSICDEKSKLPSVAWQDQEPTDRFDSGSGFSQDLDSIIFKAISETPEHRYRSVEQFSADIWRSIDGWPVEARTATRAYRLSKFYSRNKFAVAAAAMIFVALISGISIALWQARIAQASASIARIESENARAEQERSDKISKFMMRILSYANPHWHAEGYRYSGEARVIDALRDMESKIDLEFADQPDVLAEMHHQFSDVYHMRANRSQDKDAANRARDHAGRALELRRGHYGDWHELVAKDMAFVFWTQTSPATVESVQMLSDAITMMRATNPKNLNLPFMLEGYINRMIDDNEVEQADMYFKYAPQPAPTDRYLAADQMFDEMLTLMRTHFAEDSIQINVHHCMGSVVKFKANKRGDAADLFRSCEQHKAKLTSEENSVNRNLLFWHAEYQRLAGTVR